MSDLHLSVWAPDLSSQLAAIPNRRNVTFQDVLNGPGSASFDVPADDPAASHLRARNIVRVWYAPANAYVYAFRIQRPKTVVVGPNEDADRWLTVAGPGVFSLLDDAVLYPEYGLTRDSTDQRAFNYASASGSWYVSSEWSAPSYVSFTSDERYPNPADWPDKSAYWIWAPGSPDTSLSGGEIVYFRSTFSLSATTAIGIWATADNILELYLDGALIMTSDAADPNLWQKSMTYTTTLASGSHLIAAKVTNYASWPTSNPAGFLCAVATVDTNGHPQTIIRHSDSANWLARPIGTTPPGWHAAQVLRTFVTEAQARSSLTSLNHITMDFTATADSTGVSWTDIVDRTFAIGTKGTDLAEQLSELTLDIGMSPSLVLQAWKARGSDKSATVALRPGSNLTQYEVSTDLHIVTRLLVRTPNGWVEVADSGESTNGRFEDYLSLGSASSDNQATNQAAAAFTDVASPVSTFTATCVPVTGCTPYVDFSLGDTITAPDGSGGTLALRVMSLTFNEDDSGNLSYIPELYG